MSSLGILRSIDHIDFLIGVQDETDSWSDRAVGVKALGDIGTPGTFDYLKRIRARLAGVKGKENSWHLEISGLYVRD